MIKVYIGDKTDQYSLIPLLYPQLGAQGKSEVLYVGEAFRDFTKPFVTIVDSVADADFLLMPFNYFHIRHLGDLIASFEEHAERTGKKILVFAYGDSDEDVAIKNSIVFRTSRYREDKKDNEIMMPAYAEDLSRRMPISYRSKSKSGKPVVSFCGWADLPFGKRKIKYFLKIMKSSLAHLPLQKHQGIYFRKKALRLLAVSPYISTNFIIRSGYSGHRHTIELDPMKARQEYVENLLAGDFALAVKGDGNFSYRFYEALSLGRLPLFIDTACVLPLESVIDYEKIMVKVDYSEIKDIAEIAKKAYEGMSDEEYMSRQKKAREIFEKYLNISSFFEYYFSDAEKIAKEVSGK